LLIGLSCRRIWDRKGAGGDSKIQKFKIQKFNSVLTGTQMLDKDSMIKSILNVEFGILNF